MLCSRGDRASSFSPAVRPSWCVVSVEDCGWRVAIATFSTVVNVCQRLSTASWVVAEDERARCEGGGVIDGL